MQRAADLLNRVRGVARFVRKDFPGCARWRLAFPELNRTDAAIPSRAPCESQIRVLGRFANLFPAPRAESDAGWNRSGEGQMFPERDVSRWRVHKARLQSNRYPFEHPRVPRAIARAPYKAASLLRPWWRGFV